MYADKESISGSLISYFSSLVKTYGGINLAQGIPGFQPPDKLIKILATIKDQNIHQYAPGTGKLELLASLRSKYDGLYNQDTSDFMIVNGATEAISLIYTYIFRMCDNKMNVLYFTPAYESYINLPKIFGNKSFEIKLNNNEEPDIETIEETIIEKDIKLFFISSPGNPWGKIITKDKLEQIISICIKNKCYLIVDAVYNEIYYTKEKPQYPLKLLNDYVFYVNSFSKLFSITGWRIGYFLFSKNHFNKISRIHDYIGLSSPSILQSAIAEFMTDKDAVEEYVTILREAIAKNFITASASLNKYGFTVPGHEGGFFVWAKCPPKIEDSLDFAIKLYNNTKTAIIPGFHFGSGWNKYIRINIALPEESLKKGLHNINALINS